MTPLRHDRLESSLRGPDVSRQIQHARRSAQLALTGAREAAKSTGGELRALAVEAKQRIANLSAPSLPSEIRCMILESIDELGGVIREILIRRDQHILGLDRELALSDRQRAAGEEELQRITATLDQQLSDQQEIAERLAVRLAEDERFKACTQRVAEAEAALERAEAGLAEIEYDAMQKLPAYEMSCLFTYLRDRRFGTPRYSANRFNQRIDAWIGRLIDYKKARAGYDFLKNTPEQVRAWMAADREVIAPLMHQLERRRDEYAEELGLPRVSAEVKSTAQTRDRVLTDLEQIRRKKDISRQELAEVENVRGPFYRQAFELFETLLEEAQQQLAASQSLSGSGAPDEAPLADPLSSIAPQLHAIQLRVTARQQRIISLNRHLSELGYFHQRFCTAGFDSSQSTFDDTLELVRELERVREEGVSIDLVWQRMRGSQRFTPPPRTSPAAGAEQVQTQVLGTAMAQAASPAMADYARRAAARWSGSYRGGRAKSRDV